MSASIVTSVLSWVKPGYGRKHNGSQEVLAVAILGMDKAVGRAGSRENETRNGGWGGSQRLERDIEA